MNVRLLELKRERRAARLPPLAGATPNGYANILRAIVNSAVRFDVIEESPFEKAFDREKVNKPTNELSEARCNPRRIPPPIDFTRRYTTMYRQVRC